MTDFVATAEAEIDAPPEKVWGALTDPKQIEEYMFGSQEVKRIGSPEAGSSGGASTRESSTRTEARSWRSSPTND